MTTDDERPETGAPPTEIPESSQYHWEDATRPSVAVVDAVAAITDHEPRDLPRLSDHVDGDAMDALVAKRSASTDSVVSVTFAYDDIRVSISSDGMIEIQPTAACRE